MSLALRIERLQARDLFGAFSCGSDVDQAALDNFLRRYAKKNQQRQQSATWLAWAENELAGFVTIVAGAVSPDIIAEHLQHASRYPAPVLLLARMATDTRYQRQGVGAALMKRVFQSACEMADQFGCTGVSVDAKPGAASYYQALGFAFLGNSADRRMFLPLTTIRAVPRPAPE